MEFNKIEKGKSFCVICDADAEYELSNHGSLHLAWACGEHDKEITLCPHCAKQLKKLVNQHVA